MAVHTVENSPQRYARLGGALYLAIIVLGAFAEGFVANKLLVSGDAAATALSILSSPGLWRLSVAGDLIVVLCAVPLLWIEYLLLRPVSKQLVLLAVLFNLLLQIAGLSYLIACFAALFAAAVADAITPAILLPPLIGESSFCLWLLVKGVNVARWNERMRMPA